MDDIDEQTLSPGKLYVVATHFYELNQKNINKNEDKYCEDLRVYKDGGWHTRQICPGEVVFYLWKEAAHRGSNRNRHVILYDCEKYFIRHYDSRLLVRATPQLVLKYRKQYTCGRY